MAVDTRQKRFSMMNFGEGDQVLFEADGTVDADDRAHLLGLYSGISLIAVTPQVMGRFFDGARHLLRRAAWDSGT